MSPFLRSKTAIAAMAVVVVAMFAIGFVPLFGGPGYESALAAGLLLAFVVPVAVALELSGLVPGPAGPVPMRPEPFDSFCRGVAMGAALWAAAYLTTLVHGARTGFCDAATGSAHFALGPGVGALEAGAWGALAGEVASARQRRWVRRLVAVTLALAGPLVSVALSVGRFYTSPIVFAYDPFVGYFSGSLYDTVIELRGLLTYRLGSAATLVAAFAGALHLAHDRDGKLTFHGIGRPGFLVVGAIALVTSVGTIANGHRLGHWQTPETIANELGAIVKSERCDLIYPRTVRLEDAQRFARDCDAQLAAVERWFGEAGPPRVTAYLFADRDQKQRLMGARDVQIAKPWRHEVYLSVSGYPHPVLGHEIAHVVAGQWARGPFRVGGRWGGWLPDPGLIEGVATAASPKEGDLGNREWAKAMKDLGILPPLARLFALGFLGESSATAYTASGAFVEHVHARFGPAAIRRWYSGEDLAAVTGVAWPELESAWHTDLDAVVLAEQARAQAQARFGRPAIFGRRCPHVVDACKLAAERLRAAGDHAGAVEQLERAAELDPLERGLRVSLAVAQVRAGRRAEGLAELQRISADESADRAARDRALDELGDDALRSTDEAAAERRYRELLPRLLDEDAIRTVEVKVLAARSPEARAAIVALLVGVGDRPPDRARASEALASWAASAPEDGTPHYLLARQYFGTGELSDAAARLDRALSGRFLLPRVETEAVRLRMVVACGLDDRPTADAMLKRYLERPGVAEPRREAATRFVERCVPP